MWAINQGHSAATDWKTYLVNFGLTFGYTVWWLISRTVFTVTVGLRPRLAKGNVGDHSDGYMVNTNKRSILSRRCF